MRHVPFVALLAASVIHLLPLRGQHPALVRVFVADAVAVAFLAAGALAHGLGTSSPAPLDAP